MAEKKSQAEDLGDRRDRRTDQSEVDRGPSSAVEVHVDANVHVGSHHVCVEGKKPSIGWKMLADASLPLSNDVMEEGGANDGVFRIHEGRITSKRKPRKPSEIKRVSFPPTCQNGQSVPNNATMERVDAAWREESALLRWSLTFLNQFGGRRSELCFVVGWSTQGGRSEHAGRPPARSTITAHATTTSSLQ